MIPKFTHTSKKSTIKNLLLVALLFVSTSAFAQPGSIDPTFNTFDGGVLGYGPVFNAGIYKTALQPDGKIIVSGAFFSSGYPDGISYIARLNTDGTRDNYFTLGLGINNAARTISIQADGKIVLGGLFNSYNGNDINKIFRLNINGTIDSTFNVGIGFNDNVYSTAIQPDGKIIVGGGFSSLNGTNGTNRIVRLNTNGTQDTTFNTSDTIIRIPNSISIQADGKIIIGGFPTFYNSTNGMKYSIVRLHNNGAQDTTFNVGTGFNEGISSISIQADGKMIVGGAFSSFNGTTGINGIVRLNTNGTRDTTFIIGAGLNSSVSSTAVQADGKIIAGGYFSSFNGTTGIKQIVRLHTNGNLDTTFNIGTGFDYLHGVNSINIQADGKIIMEGGFTSLNNPAIDYRLVRLLSDCIPASYSQNVTACNSYKWLANGTTYNRSGTYTTKLTNAVGCDSTMILNLTINKTPDLTTSVSSKTIIANETGATYQWIDCNKEKTPIAGATNQSFTATANGSYAVIVTKNTCSGTSACVNINTIGISTIASQSEQVTIYPNPNNGAFTISATSEGVYTIQNGLGQIVQSVTLNAANNYTVNIENLSNGIYFVSGYNNNVITQQKVVVAK